MAAPHVMKTVDHFGTPDVDVGHGLAVGVVEFSKRIARRKKKNIFLNIKTDKIAVKTDRLIKFILYSFVV